MPYKVKDYYYMYNYNEHSCHKPTCLCSLSLPLHLPFTVAFSHSQNLKQNNGWRAAVLFCVHQQQMGGPPLWIYLLHFNQCSFVGELSVIICLFQTPDQ